MIKKQLFSILPVLMILCLLQIITVNGQEIDTTRLNKKPQAMGRVMVDTTPKYYGGDEACIKFLSENIKYPAEAMKLGIQGKVFVAFTLRTDGSMSDIKVLRGIGGGCDEEAIRVFKMMPKWSPAYLKGKPVEYQMVIPVQFAIPTNKTKETIKPISH